MDELAKQANEIIDRYAPEGRATLTTRGSDGMLQVTRIPNPDFVQPPVRFAEKLSLAGVHKNYNLPDGMTAIKLETYVLVLQHAETCGDMSARERKDRMTQLWQGIRARNPELQSVAFDDSNPDETMTVLRGVAGAYLPRDIGYFMSLPANKLAHACADKTYAEVYKRVTAYLGEAPRWVPALETMKSIEQQAAADKLRAFHAKRYDFD